MSTSLTASLGALPTTVTATDLAAYSEGSQSYLPRLQLVSKGKYIDLQKIAPGNWGIPQDGDNIEDLGAAVDILVLAVRDKALDTSGETPIAVYDKTNPLFDDIVSKAGEKDSGCMFGPSFLVLERNTGKLLELFFGNKSARQEAGKMAQFLPVSEAQAEQFGVEAREPQPCTLTSKLVQRPRYSWHVPVVQRCTTPFAELPPTDFLVTQIQEFLNPKQGDTPEVAEEGETRSR